MVMIGGCILSYLASGLREHLFFQNHPIYQHVLNREIGAFDEHVFRLFCHHFVAFLQELPLHFPDVHVQPAVHFGVQDDVAFLP